MTQIRVGIENNFEDHSEAWALDYPGAAATGLDGGAALVNLAPALAQYRQWVERRSGAPALPELDQMDLRVVEVVDARQLDDDYRPSASGRIWARAWFHDDWRPLSAEDVRRGLALLEYARADLLDLLGELSPEQRSHEPGGEQWSIQKIVAHLATTEWWLQDRLDLAAGPRSTLPKDPQERLLATRARTRQLLPELVDSRQVTGKDAEFWSARKFLRRVLWHERDHWMQISRLVVEG